MFVLSSISSMVHCTLYTVFYCTSQLFFVCSYDTVKSFIWQRPIPPILANCWSITFYDLKSWVHRSNDWNFCVKIYTGSMSILRIKIVFWDKQYGFFTAVFKMWILTGRYFHNDVSEAQILPWLYWEVYWVCSLTYLKIGNIYVDICAFSKIIYWKYLYLLFVASYF